MVGIIKHFSSREKAHFYSLDILFELSDPIHLVQLERCLDIDVAKSISKKIFLTRGNFVIIQNYFFLSLSCWKVIFSNYVYTKQMSLCRIDHQIDIGVYNRSPTEGVRRELLNGWMCVYRICH